MLRKNYFSLSKWFECGEKFIKLNWLKRAHWMNRKIAMKWDLQAISLEFTAYMVKLISPWIYGASLILKLLQFQLISNGSFYKIYLMDIKILRKEKKAYLNLELPTSLSSIARFIFWVLKRAQQVFHSHRSLVNYTHFPLIMFFFALKMMTKCHKCERFICRN